MANDNAREGNFLVYRSSAGSGKTSTLVSTYLQLALASKDPARFGSILAITFTNKAAREMKDRVLRELAALAQDPSTASPPTREALQGLGLEREELREKAAKILSELLHHYSRLSISTIDRFVHRIVQQFARELRIPVDFELALDQEELLKRAIDLLIARAGTEEGLTEALTGFASAKAEDDKSWHIEGDLLNASWTLLDEEGRERWEALRELRPKQLLTLRKNLQERKEGFEKKVQGIGEKGLALIEENGIDPSSFYYGNAGGLPSYFGHLKKADPEKLLPGNRVLATIEEEKWCSGKCPPDEADAIQRISDQLGELVLQARELVEKEGPEYHFISLVHEELHALSVLSGVEQGLERIRREEDLLLISDLDRIIADVIINEPAPFIYERIGDRYEDLLLDEFQDTSVLQWQNLLPLVEESLSKGHKVMLVGDGKQAIYRWRNGDVEQFIKLPRIQTDQDPSLTEEKERVLSSAYKDNADEVQKNFRSAPTIVRTNNELFPHFNRILMEGCEEVGLPELKGLFDDVEQEVGRSEGAQGYVRFEKLPKKGSPEEEDPMIDRTLELVRDSLERAKASDIAILTRSNAEGATIAGKLMEEGVEVLSGESLQLDQSPEVNFLVDLMRIVEDPGNEPAKLSCIRTLLEREGDPSTLHTKLRPYWSLDTHRKGRIDIEGYWKAEKRPFELDEARRMPLYRLAESAIRNFGLDAPATPYLQFFLDHLFEFSEKKGDDLQGFLEDWDGMKSKPSIKVPQELNAVRVMTVHSAKGLEFPIVILPHVDWYIKLNKKRIWVDPGELIPELPVALLPTKERLARCPEPYASEEAKERYRSRLDALNVLYVAMTRAEEVLYVLSRESSPSKKDPLNSIDKVLERGLQEWNGEFPEEGISLGELPEQVKEEEAEEKKGMEKVPHEAWDDRVRIRFQAPEELEIRDPDADQAFGELVHEALARIRSRKEIPDVLEALVSEGALSASRKEGVEKLIEKVVSDERVASYFEDEGTKRLFAEQDILAPDGSLMRPDRVLVDGDHARILEIKTGSPAPEHHEQLRYYRDAIADMGYRSSAELLYIHGPELVPLDETNGTAPER